MPAPKVSNAVQAMHWERQAEQEQRVLEILRRALDEDDTLPNMKAEQIRADIVIHEVFMKIAVRSMETSRNAEARIMMKRDYQVWVKETKERQAKKE